MAPNVRWLLALAAAAAVTLALWRPGSVAAPAEPGAPVERTSSSVERLYAATGPLNSAIEPGARADPESASMIRLLARDRRRGGFFVLLKEWTTTVFYSDDATRRRRVRLTARWAPARHMVGVPIPRRARPDPSADGSMTIIDPRTSCEYDFWQAKRGAAGWSASWGNTTRIDGPGVFSNGLSARGSGFALPAGVIWPKELAAGRIDHALIFSYSWPSGRGAVPPATETDGRSRRAGAIPEGARLQLDPSLDLNALQLTRYERTIARALQDYGMYLADWGGPGISLYAVHPSSFARGAYRGLLPNRRYVSLGHIPVNRLRVLDMPRPVPDRRLPKRIVPTGCARLR